MYRTSEAVEPILHARVCDLVLLQSQPASLPMVEGLYIVLRVGDAVHRTPCLSQPRESSAMAEEARFPDAPLDAETWSWNTLVQLPITPSAEARNTNASGFLLPQPATRSVSGESSLLVSPALASAMAPPAPASPSLPSISSAATPRICSPHVEVELWRSTTSAEHCIGRQVLSLANEFHQARASIEATLDQIIPLPTATAYGATWGVRLRLKVVGMQLSPSQPNNLFPAQAYAYVQAGFSPAMSQNLRGGGLRSPGGSTYAGYAPRVSPPMEALPHPATPPRGVESIFKAAPRGVLPTYADVKQS